jgi:hypothetical protein
VSVKEVCGMSAASSSAAAPAVAEGAAPKEKPAPAAGLLGAMESDYQRTLFATRSREDEGEEAEGYGYESMPLESDDEEEDNDDEAAPDDGEQHERGEQAVEEEQPPPEAEPEWIADFAAGELADPVRPMPSRIACRALTAAPARTAARGARRRDQGLDGEHRDAAAAVRRADPPQRRVPGRGRVGHGAGAGRAGGCGALRVEGVNPVAELACIPRASFFFQVILPREV